MGKPVNGNLRIKRFLYTKEDVKKLVEAKVITEDEGKNTNVRKNLAKVLEISVEVPEGMTKKGDIICVMDYDVKPYEDAEMLKPEIEVIHYSRIDYVQ